MASYKDWMTIENPNSLSERDLRRAISSMASAANKRLRRFEKAEVPYGDLTGEGTIAGVKRFGVKGKNYSELEQEFKRVRNFLESPQSSLRGMWKANTAAKKRIWGKHPTKKMRKDFAKMEKQKTTLGKEMDTKLTRYEELRRWRKTWKYYNKLIDDGIWAPSEYDSNQVREMVLYKVAEQREYHLTDDETYERIIQVMKKDYEAAQKKKYVEDRNDVSTSSLISMGSSD